ncbi:metallophosphoesterase [Lacticaseibacillus daqingensis]|uniref:metallophosphoesterase n=1 Tax=Lacticaseibacillus daqingensis TaxID=2486014 RepID=UPI000F7B6643|nr:metallophosphoesterase [Lacticaseibacillus daqingensis]
MKRLIQLATALLTLCAVAAGLTRVPQAATTTVLTTQTAPRLIVMSDPHFIAPSLHDQGAAYTAIKGSTSGKDLDAQPVALRAFVRQALAVHPVAVVLTGDVTFNGAKASAQSLAKRLAPLQRAGIAVLAVPGNHDIFDGWARAFRGKQQLTTAQLSPTDWRRIFPDAFTHATSQDADSLSTTVVLNRDYQLLLLDSNNYPIGVSQRQPNTGGRLRPSTLAWVARQLAAGQKAGRATLVFMHHNLYAHNQVVHTGYVLDNAPALAALLTKYHVPVLFSGHSHAQDIAADPAGTCTTTEVTSGSFAISPASFGVVTLAATRLQYRMATAALTPVLTAAERRDPTLTHYQAHLKQLFMGNGARLALETLYGQKGLSDQELTAAEQFLGEVNWRFFVGLDHPDAQTLAELKRMPGYKIAWATPSLRRYVQSCWQDQNLPDRQLTLTIARP